MESSDLGEEGTELLSCGCWPQERGNLDLARAEACALPTMLFCSPYLASQDESILQAPGLKAARTSFALLSVRLLSGMLQGFDTLGSRVADERNQYAFPRLYVNLAMIISQTHTEVSIRAHTSSSA